MHFGQNQGSKHVVLCVLQADLTNVRAATRAATCHLKMGQLAEASQILDTVKATVMASGQDAPPELVSKQHDLDVTKRLVSQVVLASSVTVILVVTIFQVKVICIVTVMILVIIIFTSWPVMVRSCWSAQSGL